MELGGRLLLFSSHTMAEEKTLMTMAPHKRLARNAEKNDNGWSIQL